MSSAVSTLGSAAGDEKDPPQKKGRSGVGCSVLSLIIVTTVVSTSSSLAGGLFLYFAGLRSLEATVDDTSRGETSVFRSKTLAVYDQSEQTLRQMHTFLYSDAIRTDNPQEWGWANSTRAAFFSTIKPQDLLYFISVEALPSTPLDNATSSGFYSTVWVERRPDNSSESLSPRVFLYGDTGAHRANAATVSSDGSEFLAVPCYAHTLTEAGALGAFEYSYDRESLWNVLLDADPAKGVPPSYFRGKNVIDVPGAAHAVWVPPARWGSISGEADVYQHASAVFVAPPAPHPWADYESVVVSVGFTIVMLARIFEGYSLQRPDTMILLVDRKTEVVFASTLGVGIANSTCPKDLAVGRQANDKNCFLTVPLLPQEARDAFTVAATFPLDSFATRNLGDGEAAHFVRRTLVSPAMNLELIWARPKSSVEGKIESALIILLAFVGIVAAFDIAIAVAEVSFLALPLRRVATAIEALGCLDLDRAHSAIATEAAATVMVSELRTLIRGIDATTQSIREFKRFLPESLYLSRMQQGSEDDAASAPALGESLMINARRELGSVPMTVALTDVQGSTRIWEVCTDAMRDALRVHNSVIRSCIALFHGYEVKTIGDAFMVAFPTLEAGVSFGLEVQVNLLRAAWPPPLLEVSDCSVDEATDRGGLQVRIGVHHGVTNIDFNESTRQYDLFGRTVNCVAALECRCVVGGVAILDSSLGLLSGSPLLCRAEVLPLRHGVWGNSSRPRGGDGDAESPASVLVPQELPGRVAFIRSALRQAVSPAPSSASGSSGHESAMSFSSIATSGVTSPRSDGRPCGVWRLQDQMDVSESATVGFLSLPASPQPHQPPEAFASSVNTSLVWALSCIERTGGVTLSVAGTALFVSWNVMTVCSAHVEACLRSMTLLTGSSRPDPTCGFSTGRVFAGCVGSGGMGQRYVTASGPSVDRCVAVWQRAACLGAVVLYTAEDGTTPAALCDKGIARPLMHVTVRGSPVVAYEICCSRVRLWYGNKSAPCFAASRGMASIDLEDPTYSNQRWSLDYRKAFAERDMSMLHRLSIGDPVLVKALRGDV